MLGVRTYVVGDLVMGAIVLLFNALGALALAMLSLAFAPPVGEVLAALAIAWSAVNLVWVAILVLERVWR